MKLSIIGAGILCFSAISTVNAADFVGFGVAVDLQLKSSGGEIMQRWIDIDETYSQDSSFGGEQEVIGGLNANFGFAISPQVVLQVGATVDLFETTIYKGSFSTFDTTGVSSGSTSFKEKDHYSVYLAPGYLITPKTMLYAKLAYHGMKVDYSAKYSNTDNEKSSESFNGYGLGAGIQAMLTDNLYGYVEVQRVQYEEGFLTGWVDGTQRYSADAKFRSTIGAIGIGYRF